MNTSDVSEVIDLLVHPVATAQGIQNGVDHVSLRKKYPVGERGRFREAKTLVEMNEVTASLIGRICRQYLREVPSVSSLVGGALIYSATFLAEERTLTASEVTRFVLRLRSLLRHYQIPDIGKGKPREVMNIFSLPVDGEDYASAEKTYRCREVRLYESILADKVSSRDFESLCKAWILVQEKDERVRDRFRVTFAFFWAAAGAAISAKLQAERDALVKARHEQYNRQRVA